MKQTLLTLLAVSTAGCAREPSLPQVTIRFADSGAFEVPVELQRRIVSTIMDVGRSVESLLPSLPDSIAVSVVTVDRDLSVVGGVAGRASTPREVVIELSALAGPGASTTLPAGLGLALYHEFHHLARGWTIEGNRFGPGIPTAVVNEGLAQVFGEIYSGTTFEVFDYPAEVAAWLDEILALPKDANYDAWMNRHPDGRNAVGYRVGRYVVHEAMRRSGRSIVELSPLDPEEILALATG